MERQRLAIPRHGLFRISLARSDRRPDRVSRRSVRVGEPCPPVAGSAVVAREELQLAFEIPAGAKPLQNRDRLFQAGDGNRRFARLLVQLAEALIGNGQLFLDFFVGRVRGVQPLQQLNRFPVAVQAPPEYRPGSRGWPGPARLPL